MDDLRTLRWSAPGSSPPDDRAGTATAPASPSARPAPPTGIDPAMLAQLAHDLRSPLTVLVCNRRFLQEIIERAGIDDPDVRDILEDDAAALARLEQAVAGLDVVSRRSR